MFRHCSWYHKKNLWCSCTTGLSFFFYFHFPLLFTFNLYSCSGFPCLLVCSTRRFCKFKLFKKQIKTWEAVIQSDRHRDRERTHKHWFTPQMSSPGHSVKHSAKVAGIQAREPSTLPSRVHWQEVESELRPGIGHAHVGHGLSNFLNKCPP